ncbi:MAG: molybdopterin-dependent oxidoreductase, partial [Pseudomonadota bacterium]|nr:molybdopterin-dependent oxidoreductase [Pseudomonadota bacterium]
MALDGSTEKISFTLDGKTVSAAPGETIWQVAQGNGIDIPHLCYAPSPGYRADGNCRACMVEIEGERVLAASCIRRPEDGMVVQSGSARATSARKMVFELLVADQPSREKTHDKGSQFWSWAERLDIEKSRFPAQIALEPDLSHPAMAVNLDACINCTLCIRACREVQVNDVIGMAGRGAEAKIVFDFDDPMGDSTCVACGECVQACPTGALLPSTVTSLDGLIEPDRQVDSICPYCGVGCQLTYKIKEDKLLSVDGRDGPANHNRLCVKGRFGFDYIHHPDRLTRPLIRKGGIAKDPDANYDPATPLKYFREATWDEALEFAASGLKKVMNETGGSALAGFGSAKGSNEEAYLFQKLVRTGFGNNNVDHCTRLCHASSVAALMETVNSGAVSAPFYDVAKSDVIIVIGANPTVNHPVAATFFKNAVNNGAKLIVIDPRGQALSRHATHMIQ